MTNPKPAMMKATGIFVLFALLLFACGTEPQKDTTAEAFEEVAEEVEERSEQADQSGESVKRRIRSGNNEGSINAFFNGDELLRIDINWPDVGDGEHDRYVFNQDGRLIFSTHTKRIRIANIEVPTQLEFKFLYNNEHQIVNVLSRRGQLSEGQTDLEHLAFAPEESPNLEALNDTYVSRLNLALENLGRSDMIR
jgi:hypothetical protein